MLTLTTNIMIVNRVCVLSPSAEVRLYELSVCVLVSIRMELLPEVLFGVGVADYDFALSCFCEVVEAFNFGCHVVFFLIHVQFSCACAVYFFDDMFDGGVFGV